MILEGCKLTKEYADGTDKVRVIDSIDLVLPKGKAIAIVGSSGSGKSTLLHILGGLDIPSYGYVKVMGKEFSRLKEKERSQLRNKFFGFIYQHHHLLRDFTVLENIIVPLLIGGASFKTAREKAKKLLKLVYLQDKEKSKINQLSGGEKQRVAILRAIVTNPQCILADEPTGNLDQHTAMAVYQTLIDLKNEFETGLIIVTHDLKLAKLMEETYSLIDGKLTLAD